LLSHRKPCVTLASEEQHATLGSLPTPYTRAGSHTASEIHGGEALTGVRRGEQDPCNALRYPTVNPPLRAVRRGVKVNTSSSEISSNLTGLRRFLTSSRISSSRVSRGISASRSSSIGSS